MLRRNHLIVRSAVLFVIAAAMLLLNGCGELSPVSNETEIQKEPFGAEQVEQQWGRVFTMKVDHAVDLVTSPDHPVEIDIGAGGYNA
ncbi:MAG: hypothetical protein GF315_02010, partial [candidate division Zixibacteria bacterium]|nr:hypothetical protein [candidate division Zixibacteria bacterium]